MKHLIATAVAGLAILTIASEAFAGPRNHRVGRTEGRQMHRINEGARSGQLTREEAKGLRQEQKGINQERKEAFRNDGKIDKQEMKEIRQDQKEASQHIREEKHDAETRPQ